MCRLTLCLFGYVGRGWISVSLQPYLPQLLPPLHTPPAPVPVAPLDVFASIEVFDGDGEPNIWPTRCDDPLPIPSSFGITSVYTEEAVDPTPQFYTATSAPPELSSFTI